MSDYATITDRVRDFARFLKEEERDDLPPTLVAIREGWPAAAIHHSELSELLAIAPLVAPSYGADALALVFEGVFPRVPSNPLTGAAWQRGEADEIWRDHDGVTQGWVAECQLVSTVSRDGHVAVSGQPFRLMPDHVDWSDDVEGLSGGLGVERALTRAFERPAIDPSQIPDPGDRFVAEPGAPFMSAERGRITLDVGATRTIDNRFLTEIPEGGARLVFSDEESFERMKREGLSSWQGLVFLHMPDTN